MPSKALLFTSILAVVAVACAIFIAWRLRRIAAQRAEAEQRAVGAFEEMNRLTKQLRDRGRNTPVDPSLAPGKRLQAMYPGPKRSGDGTPPQ